MIGRCVKAFQPACFSRCASVAANRTVPARHASSLIAVENLTSFIGKQDIRIVDLGTAEEYNRAHIPSAVRCPADSSFKIPGTPHVIPGQAFDQLATALQVEPDTKVVFYDSGSMLAAARAWWMFQYYGHKNTYVVDGGWAAYLTAGLKATHLPSSLDSLKHEEFITAKPMDAWKITGAELAKRIKQHSDLQVLDARTQPEYKGLELRGNRRGGHVPGAVNVPHATYYRGNGDFRLKSTAELEGLFSSAGLARERPVAAYCQAGVRAALATLALHEAGYSKAANYDASMGEWLNHSEFPVEK